MMTEPVLRGRAWRSVAVEGLPAMALVLASGISAAPIVDLRSDVVTVSLSTAVGSIVPPVVSAAFAITSLLALAGREAEERPTAARESNP